MRIFLIITGYVIALTALAGIAYWAKVTSNQDVAIAFMLPCVAFGTYLLVRSNWEEEKKAPMWQYLIKKFPCLFGK